MAAGSLFAVGGITLILGVMASVATFYHPSILLGALAGIALVLSVLFLVGGICAATGWSLTSPTGAATTLTRRSNASGTTGHDEPVTEYAGMSRERRTPASVNSTFAETILHRASEIFAAGQGGNEPPTAYAALLQARNEFVEKETASERRRRTYVFPQLAIDLDDFIRQRHAEYTAVAHPINRWNAEQPPHTVVTTLQEAAVYISDQVAARDRAAAKFGSVSEDY